MTRALTFLLSFFGALLVSILALKARRNGKSGVGWMVLTVVTNGIALLNLIKALRARPGAKGTRGLVGVHGRMPGARIPIPWRRRKSEPRDSFRYGWSG
jgi:hypothetical protein